MTLSKKRNALRMRNVRALKRGVQPSATDLIEVLSVNQRKERLAELITTPIDPEKITPTHVIAAVDVYNKMDHVYSESPTVNIDNRKVEILVYDKGTKSLVQRLLSGEQPGAIERSTDGQKGLPEGMGQAQEVVD